MTSCIPQSDETSSSSSSTTEDHDPPPTPLLYGHGGSPYLCLGYGKHSNFFVVDTGCPVSIMTRKIAEEWGIDEDIVPDDTFVDQEGYVYVDITTWYGMFLDNVRFQVENTKNLIVGLDFLFRFNCTLVLHPSKPLLYFSTISDDDFPINHDILQNILINDQPFTVRLDTGYEGLINGREEDADALGLQLKKLDKPMIFDGFQTFQADYGAPVTLRLGSREEHGTYYLLDNGFNTAPLVGMHFLLGGVFRFRWSDGELESHFSFPEDDDP